MRQQLDNPLDGRSTRPVRDATHAYLLVYNGKCDGAVVDMADSDTARFVADAITTGAAIERVTLDIARDAVGKPWPRQVVILGRSLPIRDRKTSPDDPMLDGRTWRVIPLRNGSGFEISDEAGVVQVAEVGGALRRGRADLIAAAPAMLLALLHAGTIRPDNWDDGSDPEQEAAWRGVDDAIAAAEGRAS